MKYRTLLLCLFGIFGGNLLQANKPENPHPKTIKLCTGEIITWEDYIEYKTCMQEEWDNNEVDFVNYEEMPVNDIIGAWSTVINLPLISAAAANLPNGRVMLWSARDKFSFGGDQGRTWTAIFDPTTNTSTEALITNTGHDMFCPGVSTLPDGRIMVTGGSSSNKASIYDINTNQWQAADQMNIARGYHANVTLASGSTFVVGGSWSGGIGNKHAEIWTQHSGWHTPMGIPVEVITDGTNSPQTERANDYFPWLWLAPNGKLFHAGPSQSMHWIDPTGVGSYTYAGERGDDAYSASGTTVMFDIGKILKAGGGITSGQGGDANNLAYVIDINSDNPIVTKVGDLAFSRNVHNSVVLPNGEVLVIGGIPEAKFFSDVDSRLNAELWNPTTGQWTTMAAMDVPRNYHSIALLLADGRVLTSGGGLCGTCPENHPDAQIFSPPYLFNPNGTLATRPQLNNVPSNANYNSSIQVSSNMAINSFALVKNSGTTHSTNNDQRRIPLTFTSDGANNYTLNIPNRNILPPGSYMLFAMNNNGVPSIAQFLQIGENVHSTIPIANNNLGGDGLNATYFNAINLTNPAYEQVDSAINYDFGSNSPSEINNDNYSIRWEGFIEVPRDGGYTFYTNSDDGVRLWVDNRLIVDNWTAHSNTEDIGEIVLEAGIKYPIKLEYFEAGGLSLIQLRWSGPGINKNIVEQQYLFTTDCANNACNDNDDCTINDTFDNNCNCIGTFLDSDNDGICDANDTCPNGDDNVDSDNDGIPDDCDSCSTVGATCDDNDDCTINDTFDDNCNCIGTFLDSDSDGICDADDDCPFDPNNNCISSYCDLSASNTNYEFIQKVVFGDINNDSGNDSGYGNYTYLATTIVAGQNYAIELSPGFPFFSYQEGFAVWIDFNADGFFDTTEKVYTGISNSTQFGTINIPSNISSGQTRMRVAMRWNALPLDPCGGITYGEVEDYTILLVGEGNPCAIGTPCDDGDNCTINDSFDNNCNCTGIFQDTDNDGICDTNDECPNDPSNNCNQIEYCNLEGINTNYEFIQKVVLGNINNESGDDGGYGDYTNLSTLLNPGQSYPIELTPGYTGHNYIEAFTVWIDFNKDGIFDNASEQVFLDSGNAAINGTITVPSNASVGATRMRVAMRWNTPQFNPCGSMTYGEVEDYTVQIGSVASLIASLVLNQNDIAIKVFPNPVQTELTIQLNQLLENGNLEIYNAKGLLIEKIYLRNQMQSQIQVGDWAAGIYFVRLQQEGQQPLVKRFIKQ